MLPTRLPLRTFYHELVKTQAVLDRKPLGFAARGAAAALGLAARGRTNFIRSLWKFGRVYNADRQYNDRFKASRYTMRPPTGGRARPSPRATSTSIVLGNAAEPREPDASPRRRYFNGHAGPAAEPVVSEPPSGP